LLQLSERGLRVNRCSASVSFRPSRNRDGNRDEPNGQQQLVSLHFVSPSGAWCAFWFNDEREKGISTGEIKNRRIGEQETPGSGVGR
jgi:hypothetical protein